MSGKPGSADPTSQHNNNLYVRSSQLALLTSSGINSFEQFADLYCPSVFSSVAGLSGITDEEELETITADVLICLWDKQHQLAAEKQQGVFIYKTVLQCVFVHLKEKGNTDRIDFLRDSLLIDPKHYLHVLNAKQQPVSFWHKIRRIWKTY